MATSHTLKLSGYDLESFADADGVSCVLFVSGCKHNCKGCHSPQTHDFDYGVELNDEMIAFINSEIDKRPYINALVLSGGDPMYSAKQLLSVLDKLHIPNNNLWIYSGFTLSDIQADADMNALLERCNHLVDGLFDINCRDITLAFRGSSNQNVWKKVNNTWIKEYQSTQRSVQY